jgi:hypothetical protein
MDLPKPFKTALGHTYCGLVVRNFLLPAWSDSHWRSTFATMQLYGELQIVFCFAGERYSIVHSRPPRTHLDHKFPTKPYKSPGCQKHTFHSCL